MKPGEFIRFAEKLAVQPGAVPAVLRTAASRAYYGAFHLTREFLIDLGFRPGANHNLHNWLTDSSHPAAKKLARCLSDLQTERIRADYELDRTGPESPNSARRAVEMARDFETYLADCQSQAAREQITKDVRACLAKQSRS